jgi:hypothetical protein
MDQKERGTEDKNSGDKQLAGKKPYHKPSFRYEHVFETMALACGKISRRSKSCRLNSKS